MDWSMGHALTLSRFYDHDGEVVLLGIFDSMRLCREGSYEAIEPFKAIWAFERSQRGFGMMARWDLRSFVGNLRLSSFPLSGMDDHELVALIENGIKRGDLVAVKKVDPAELASRPVDPPVAKLRLIREIEAKLNGRMTESGRQYKLLRDIDFENFPERNYYHVVRQDEAKQVLDALVKQSGTSAELAELFVKARDQLTRDWGPLTEPDGLILLRRAPPARAPAANQEPAITPSQMRKLIMERTWYEVLLVDEIGQPVANVELRFDIDGDALSTRTGNDGRGRLERPTKGKAVVRFADAKALLDTLDRRWANDRPDDWIVPPEGATVLEIYRADASWKGPIPLQAEETAIIVLEPPYWVRLFDENEEIMANLACQVSVGDNHYDVTSDPQGWIEFPVGQQCPESATVEWAVAGRNFSREVMLNCHDGDRQVVARARLHNLGYQDDHPEDSMAAFQLDRDLDIGDFDAADSIPEGMLSAVSSEWNRRHD